MKEISKNYRFYLKFLLIIFLFTFLSGCGGVTITDPIIISFSADVTIITEGDSATLSWEVTETTAVTIDPGIGLVDLTGFVSVFPVATTTYTLTATNSCGQVFSPSTRTAMVTITVNPAIVE
ncbi:MAG: hypothetical protein KAH35_08190 [Candidatus Atribacteria bacterium]|nr:hypothetical protein [Candidatus Atribacteria bacterium]